jgi:outer membrane usher protein
MRSFRRPTGSSRLSKLAAATSIIFLLGIDCSMAQKAVEQNLQLEVTLNSAPSNIVASFIKFADGRIGASRDELENIGLVPGDRQHAGRVVMLDEIPSLTYRYDEPNQRIAISAASETLKPQAFDLAGNGARTLLKAQAGWGGVLNYDLVGSAGDPQSRKFAIASGTSALIDARAFSPFGTFEQSAILQSGINSMQPAIRLGTSFRHSDPERLMSYVAGDTITGGLPWSRPIRIGGLQVQSNFALRPDLVTSPLPVVGGSAAVPSTVDLYVNNVKTFSQEVASGPFSISNVPAISGAGNAELVVRDSAGRETRMVTPFYASSSLLAPGLMSWSAEAGLPRLSYGSASDTYVSSPVGSATLRGGIYDGLTVEAHGEAGAGLLNGGLGAVARTGSFGVAAAAVSASASRSGNGLQVYASYETRLFGLTVSASSQRSFGPYEDLASVTARLGQFAIPSGQNFYNGVFLPLNGPVSSGSFAYATGLYSSSRPSVDLHRITLGSQLPFDQKANVSGSFVYLKDALGASSRILTATYSRPLAFNASFFMTGFRDLGSKSNTGIFAGLTLPLGDNMAVSAGVSHGANGTAATIDAAKSIGTEPGSYGWRVRDAEGAWTYREASASYLSNYATVRAGVSQSGTGGAGFLGLRGSIATLDGGVFLSNWIDDGFAVVATGMPGVPVLNENRTVGVTDASGRLLIPNLRSYQKNGIAIDPANLPVDADVREVREIASPADRAGVLVKFDIRKETTSALVTFVSADGKAIPAGSSGTLLGGNPFVVGYDGLAFIKNLSADNSIEILNNGSPCRANFSFTPRPGEQVRISPVVCR